MKCIMLFVLIALDIYFFINLYHSGLGLVYIGSKLCVNSADNKLVLFFLFFYFFFIFIPAGENLHIKSCFLK